jgi:hypothetical protein
MEDDDPTAGWCIARGTVTSIAVATSKWGAGLEMGPDNPDPGPGAAILGLDLGVVALVGPPAESSRLSRRKPPPSGVGRSRAPVDKHVEIW